MCEDKTIAKGKEGERKRRERGEGEREREVKLDSCRIRRGIKFKVSALHLISGAMNKEAPCPSRIRTHDEANQSANFKGIPPL